MKLIVIMLLCAATAVPAFAGTVSMKTDDVEVVFGDAFNHVARELITVYPSVKLEIEKKLPWKVDIRPRVILVNDRAAFKKMSGSDIILAFAVSKNNLIVLDMSKVYAKPFTLETTLRHELCHLVLHRHVNGERMPRWMDEGVCQWMSGGIDELMYSHDRNILAGAAMSDGLFSMDQLRRFPNDEKSLILAYEQSRNFIEYIISEFGEDGIVDILRYLKEGDSVSRSFEKSISLSLPQAEEKWHTHLKGRYARFSYLSNNLYTILFSLAALATMYGFIRVLRKKREYRDEETDEDREGPGMC
jgi:hypothetical protein